MRRRLKLCPPHGHDGKAVAALSIHERQKRFQYWVECTRTASSVPSSEISSQESLTCPLLWCRTSFKDLSSNLRHISSCPWLSDAWYWCPYCCRPESFIECGSTSPANAHRDEPEEAKSFRCAVAFFKDFGHKVNGCPRSSGLPNPDASVGYTSANTHGSDQRLEIGDISCDILRPVNIDSNKAHEMDGRAQCVTPAFETSLPCNKYMPTTASPHVRESDYLASTPPYPPQSASFDSSATAVSVQSRNSDSSNDVVNQENQTIISHASLIQESARNDTGVPSLDLSPLNNQTLRPFSSEYSRRCCDFHQVPMSRTQATMVSPSPAYNAAETARNEIKSKSHAHIAELCDVVRALSEEWIGRLALSTNIAQLYPEQHARALFELGIRALRNHFRGVTPTSFQDIFALMHVAMASSYIVRKDDHAYSWTTFLEEACRWQHLLSDGIEKRAFIKVLSRLCPRQESTTSSSFRSFAMDNAFLPAEHATLVRLLSHLSSTCADLAIQEEGDKSLRDSTIDTERIRLSGIFRSNVIIKGCTDFLDTFGHAVITEDLANRQINSLWYIEQHMPGIDMLDSNIFGRLQEWEGLEAFRAVVTETQSMLRCGLLHSARDVEVMLVWSGNSYSRSSRLLRTYLEVVKYLCDKVMKDSGLHWRNHFYEAILGTVLATASELSPRRGHAFQIPHGMLFGNLALSYNASTPTACAAMPPAEPDAPTSFSPDSVQTSSASSDNVSHCPDPSCKASFTGSSQKTNLRRHLRTALHHNQDAQFKCDVCGLTFGRSDNLQQHIRNIHGRDPASASQSSRASPNSRGLAG